MFSSKKIMFSNNKVNCPSPVVPLCHPENDCNYIQSFYENGCPASYGCGCTFNEICGPCVSWSSEPQDHSGGTEVTLNFEYSTSATVLETLWQQTDDDLNWSPVEIQSSIFSSQSGNTTQVSGNITISSANHVVGRKYRVFVRLQMNESEVHTVWSRSSVIEFSSTPVGWSTTYIENAPGWSLSSDSSISLNHNGDVFAVGNPSEDSGEGAVYIYKKFGGDTWINTTENKLRPTGYVAKTTRYTVTASNGKYYINGSMSPSLILNEGENYIFDVSHSSNSGHPFKFSTTSDGSHNGGSSYSINVEEYGTAGTSGAYVMITVPLSVVDLYYYCSNHSGMGNLISTRSVSHSNKFFGSSVKLNRYISSFSSDGETVIIGEPGSNKIYSYFYLDGGWAWNYEIYDRDNNVANFGKDLALNNLGNFVLVRSENRIKLYESNSGIVYDASPFLTSSGDNVFIKTDGFPNISNPSEYSSDIFLTDSLSRTLKTFVCQNPPISKNNISTQDWQYSSSSFNLDNFSFPYYISMNYDCSRMVLSGQGRTVVYDRNGSDWVQFGQEIEGQNSKMCYLGNRVVTYVSSLQQIHLYQRNLNSFDKIGTFGSYQDAEGTMVGIRNYDFAGDGRTLVLITTMGVIVSEQN